ncbi:MAG: 2-amino-4-hydroxy-6-hydroxymethyldihydropteridine diphosphokinase [Actinomycetota bacterium]
MTTDGVRAFLGLGSNIGDRRAQLRAAVAAMPDVVAVSPVYETDPVGGPAQDDYLNIVVELRTRATARELLARCQELEAAAERVRVVRWGPRTLDVDVLLVGDEVVADDDLAVPHARMHERNFVMVPLLALDPTIAIDGYDPATAIGTVRSIGPL